MTPLDTLTIARNFVARGFSVIPLDHPDDTWVKTPEMVGKTPAVKTWTPFQMAHPTDADLVGWFGNGRKRNTALVTGKISNVVMVDGDSAEGLAWMRAHLPATPMRTKTAKGEHWGFRHPGVPVRNKVRIQTGDPSIKIDVRGDGGYVVAPGSLHASRITYEPIGVWPPVNELPVFDPAWLEPDPDLVATPNTLPSTIPHGQQHQTLFHEGCRLRRRGYAEAEIADALWSLHKHRSEGPDVHDEKKDVEKIAKSICDQYEPGLLEKAGTGGAIVIHRASDVPDEKLEKMFGGRLVRGAFALVAGPGEGGKGMFMVDTATRFTTGEPFPNEKARRDPAAVLLCVTEDSNGRVKSRLRAAGADLDLVFFVEGPEMARGGLTMPSPMMLDDDAGKLVTYARQINARAIFLETMVEHFGDREGKASRRSTNNEADVRSALAPFRAVCVEARLYGEASIHPRKSMEGSVDDSISGSAAFRNVTRAAHHIYRDPEDEADNPVRLLFTSKANYLSRRPATLRFRIRSWDEERGLPCLCPHDECPHEGRIVWDDDPVDYRLAEEIWHQIAERNKPRRDVNVQEAEGFLTGLMQDGVIALTPVEIFKLASAEAINKAAVKRAKENMRLVSKKEGFPAVVVGWQVEKEEF